MQSVGGGGSIGTGARCRREGPGDRQTVWRSGRRFASLVRGSRVASSGPRILPGKSDHTSAPERHILVDTLGLLLNVVVHPADVQDRDGLPGGAAVPLLEEKEQAWSDALTHACRQQHAVNGLGRPPAGPSSTRAKENPARIAPSGAVELRAVRVAASSFRASLVSPRAVPRFSEPPGKHSRQNRTAKAAQPPPKRARSMVSASRSNSSAMRRRWSRSVAVLTPSACRRRNVAHSRYCSAVG
jgi:hypothetical protein